MAFRISTNLIQTDTRTHAQEEVANADIRAVYTSQRECIDDSTALTIASWWAAPGGTGEVMTTLSTTGKVNFRDLLDDIASTRHQYADGLPFEETMALDCLVAWATTWR